MISISTIHQFKAILPAVFLLVHVALSSSSGLNAAGTMNGVRKGRNTIAASKESSLERSLQQKTQQGKGVDQNPQCNISLIRQVDTNPSDGWLNENEFYVLLSILTSSSEYDNCEYNILTADLGTLTGLQSLWNHNLTCVCNDFPVYNFDSKNKYGIYCCNYDNGTPGQRPRLAIPGYYPEPAYSTTICNIVDVAISMLCNGINEMDKQEERTPSPTTEKPSAAPTPEPTPVATTITPTAFGAFEAFGTPQPTFSIEMIATTESSSSETSEESTVETTSMSTSISIDTQIPVDTAEDASVITEITSSTNNTDVRTDTTEDETMKSDNVNLNINATVNVEDDGKEPQQPIDLWELSKEEKLTIELDAMSKADIWRSTKTVSTLITFAVVSLCMCLCLCAPPEVDEKGTEEPAGLRRAQSSSGNSIQRLFNNHETLNTINEEGKAGDENGAGYYDEAVHANFKVNTYGKIVEA